MIRPYEFKLNTMDPLATGMFLGMFGRLPGTSRALDESLRRNSGTLTGYADVRDGWKYDAELGRYVNNFHGTNGALSLSKPLGLLGTDFSIAFWFKHPDTSGQQYHVTLYGDISARIASGGTASDEDVLVFRGQNTAWNNILTAPSHVAGQWYHYAITYSGTAGYTMYRDGDVVDSNVSTTGIVARDDTNWLGGLSATTELSKAMVGDATMIRRALALPEIRRLASRDPMYQGLLLDSSLSSSQISYFHITDNIEFESAPLFIDGVGEEEIERTLFIEGRTHQTNSSIPLYVENLAIDNFCPLYVRADGMWEGLIPYGEGRPLYLYNQGEDQNIVLFCRGDSPINSLVSLHIVSKISENESITLAMPNVKSDLLNSCISLCVTGGIPVDENIDLYTYGHGVVSEPMENFWLLENGESVLCENGNDIILLESSTDNTITLMVKQDNKPINTFMPLYVFGAHFEDENITLAMPNTIDYDNKSIPLYLFGW